MAKTYYFKTTDKGVIGKAFEMAIKDALHRRNADRVSPCGVSDFRYKARNYDAKQNGSVLCYAEGQGYIKGSNRVIYATHVSHEMHAVDDDHVAVTVDLFNTDMHVLDRRDFVDFLESIGCVKRNAARGTVNIQTVFNYKRDAYHGRKGRMIEAWAFENDLGDDIIGDILAGLE